MKISLLRLLEARWYDSLYDVSFILKNKDKDIESNYRICKYYYNWSVYATDLLLICRH